MKPLDSWQAVALVGLSTVLLSALPGKTATTVQLLTEPPLSQVTPAQQPVSLTLQAVDQTGQSLADVQFYVQLRSPAKTPWLTSDFPVVEGTPLLELRAIAPDGQLQFQQVMPIRGTYELVVNAAPQQAGAFSPIQQTLTVTVPENPARYRNALILAALLLLTGAGGGWVIAAKQTLRPGELAPQSVQLLFTGASVVAIAALLTINISAELSQGHDHAHHHHHHPSDQAVDPISTVQQSGEIEVQLLGGHHATVGELLDQTIQVLNQTTGSPVQNAALTIEAIRLENNEPIFSMQATPNAAGQFTWQQQFFDGAPHQVRVKVSPQPDSVQPFAPITVGQVIEVEGIEPPLLVRLISLGYYTSFLILGVLLGWVMRDRTTKRATVQPS